MENINVIKENLFSTRAKDRLKAAKQIGSQKINSLSDDLLKALVEELKNPDTWETQSAMITSLGILEADEAMPYISAICEKNIDKDMVTSQAAKAYVRIKRKDLSDISPVIDLLDFGKYAVLDGAFRAIGEDQMHFTDEEIKYLINFVKKIPIKKEKGFMDIRYGIALACIGWNKNLDVVQNFLNDCVNQDQDKTLSKVAEKALKRI